MIFLLQVMCIYVMVVFAVTYRPNGPGVSLSILYFVLHFVIFITRHYNRLFTYLLTYLYIYDIYEGCSESIEIFTITPL